MFTLRNQLNIYGFGYLWFYSIVREQESPDECRPMYFNKEKYEKM